MTVKNLLTLSEIAKKLGVERHRVQYAVRYGNIAPTSIAGSTKLFDAVSVKAIEDRLTKK